MTAESKEMIVQSKSDTGRARASRRRSRSVNIAEFSGIPRIHSSDSDPTVGAAGARGVFGLYFHLARFTAQETLARARIAESGSRVATSEIRRANGVWFLPE
ncbi:hypothetical protein F2P79_001875 [Pimephales promelas]|nr:hypothetical protein F2P79_001875 [Pimephales promelas]